METERYRKISEASDRKGVGKGKGVKQVRVGHLDGAVGAHCPVPAFDHLKERTERRQKGGRENRQNSEETGGREEGKEGT